MIDPKQLRVGNLLLRKSVVVIVDGIENATAEYHECWLIWLKNSIALNINQFAPIPLTDEWLERCGFEKDGFNAYNLSISPWPDLHLKQLSFSSDYFYLREGDLGKPRHEDHICVLWNNDIRGIMNVHQLQNLYFALTGEEIKIKELV